MRGQLINVPVLERPGTTRIGRFGWKNQQASLVSFSADAYVNEMGITSPLQPDENTSNGTSVAAFDRCPGDPDDEGVDVELFALFMRSTQGSAARPGARGDARTRRRAATSSTASAAAPATRATIVTAAPGTLINGGALRVANALGNKIIQPFGDFLLHDIGTGDGIVQNGGHVDAQQGADGAAVGPAGARPVHARRAQLQPDRRDSAPRQPGAASRDAFNGLSNDEQEQADRVPVVAVRSAEGQAARCRVHLAPSPCCGSPWLR